MILLRVNQFQGQIPGAAAQLLPDNAAQIAVNCKLVNGNMAAIRKNSVANTPAKAGTITSIYKFGDFWFHWLADVDCIRSMVASNTVSKTYFTEGGEMRVTDATIATTGGTQYPMDWYKVGVPAPSATLFATLVGSADDPDDYANTESRSYLYTYVSADGEEGPPSPASNIVDWNPGQTVSLSNFPAAPVGDYQITQIRVYRYEATEYRHVATGTIPVADGVIDDIDSDLVAASEALQSMYWYPPPDGIHSIVNHPSSFVIGAVNNEIYISEAGLSHAFNPYNVHTVPYDIVGLGITGQGVLILTGAGLWYAAGTEPDSFGPPEKLETDQACVSKQSIFEIDGAVGYASPDGLYAYGFEQSGNLAPGLFTLDQWRALNPSSMTCAYHDGKIFVFYDNGAKGGFIVYPGETSTKVDLDFHATAAFVDKETDTLYLMVGTNIVAYEGGTGDEDAQWKGKLTRTPYHCCPGAAVVRATGYPVTLKLYTDGTLRYMASVTSAAPFRLPSGYLAEEFEVECLIPNGAEVEGVVADGIEVSEIIIAESMADLRQV